MAQRPSISGHGIRKAWSKPVYGGRGEVTKHEAGRSLASCHPQHAARSLPTSLGQLEKDGAPATTLVLSECQNLSRGTLVQESIALHFRGTCEPFPPLPLRKYRTSQHRLACHTGPGSQAKVASSTHSPRYHVSQGLHSDLSQQPEIIGRAEKQDWIPCHPSSAFMHSRLDPASPPAQAPDPAMSLKHHHHLLLHQEPRSNATHCSLRGDGACSSSHPLKQNPPSIASLADHFDEIDIADELVRPPPSALTAPTAYDPHASPSPLPDYPASASTSSLRSQSWFENCQPFLNKATSTLQQHTSRTSFHSPTKSLASFIPSRSVIESTAGQPKLKAGAKALQNWFNGSSGPVGLGVSSQDYSDDDYDSEDDYEDEGSMMAGIFNRGPALTRPTTSDSRDSTPAPAKAQTTTPTAGSKFAWLLSTQKNAAIPPPVPSPTYHNPSDELINLNISQALFPHGPVDPLAPSSFNDLLSTAESLLTRYQTSYRQLSTAMSDARAEQSAQDDELDEAETRVRHLKMQLETMAARATEQDAQMQKLMEELAIERRSRREEEAARKRSLALVKGHGGYQNVSEEQSRRRNRISNSELSVDSGFESECESEAASIFSSTNCMSPTDTNPSSAASINMPYISENDTYSHNNDTTPKGTRPHPVHRRSTYDKVRDGSVALESAGWGCTNCEGGAQASVWGRLSREREESSALRRRVEQLEQAVEGALNVVDGPWGM